MKLQERRFMINTGVVGANPEITDRIKFKYIHFNDAEGTHREMERELSADYFLKLWLSGNNGKYEIFFNGSYRKEISIDVSSNKSFVQINLIEGVR